MKGKIKGILLIAVFILTTLTTLTLVSAPGTEVETYYPTLGATGAAKAEWSTTYSVSGDYSVHLKTTGDPQGDEARIVITMPTGFTLEELETISWKAWTVAGYPAHVDIYLAMGESLNAETNMNPNNWDAVPLDYGGWLDTLQRTDATGHAIITDDATVVWINSQGGGPVSATYGTLADFVGGTETLGDGDSAVVIDGTSVVTKLEIEIDSWISTTEVYIDDIKVNGDSIVYDFEPSIVLDYEYYKMDDVVTATVFDIGLNERPAALDTGTFSASSEYPDLIDVDLLETGIQTCVFEGTFTVVDETPGANDLIVNEGATITATYLETTPATAIVDDVDPVIAITAPSPEAVFINGETVSVTTTYEDNTPGTYSYKLDGVTFDTEYPGTLDTTEYTDGEYIITVVATDGAGNTGSDDVTVNIDNTGPTITDATASPAIIGLLVETDIVLTVTVVDAGIGTLESVTVDATDIDGGIVIMDYDELTDDGTYTATLTDVEVDTEDTYELTITARDDLLNENEEIITIQVIEDDEAPSDVSFTEVESICGGLIVKGLTAVDPTSGVKQYSVYVDDEETSILDITVDDLSSTTWTDGLYKGTFVLDLSAYVGDTVEVTAVAIDYAANEADPVTLYSGEVPEGTWYPVELYEGWNLVSLPLIPDSSHSGDIKSLILDQGASGVVITYEYDQYADTWITNPTDMTDGYGYWLYMLDYDVMIVEGIETLPAPALPQTYEFTEGWVLAGYKQTSATNDPEGIIDDYLASLEDPSYFTTIYVWDAATPAWVTLDTTETTGENILSPGMGFWIWMYSDQNLIAPLE